MPRPVLAAVAVLAAAPCPRSRAARRPARATTVGRLPGSGAPRRQHGRGPAVRRLERPRGRDLHEPPRPSARRGSGARKQLREGGRRRPQGHRCVRPRGRVHPGAGLARDRASGRRPRRPRRARDARVRQAGRGLADQRPGLTTAARGASAPRARLTDPYRPAVLPVAPHRHAARTPRGSRTTTRTRPRRCCRPALRATAPASRRPMTVNGLTSANHLQRRRASTRPARRPRR